MNTEIVAAIILFILVAGYIFSIATGERAKKRRRKALKEVNDELKRLEDIYRR